MKTEINHFDDLLRAAREHCERQRRLFVFAGTELPDGATPEQRERFAQGEGGVLVPMMCLDRLPEELESFDGLLRESRQFEPPGTHRGISCEQRGDEHHNGSERALPLPECLDGIELRALCAVELADRRLLRGVR